VSDVPVDESIDPELRTPKKSSSSGQAPTKVEDFPGGSLIVGELLPEAETEEVAVDALTDEERVWMRSLFTVGRKEKIINLFDHEIKIQSLKCSDELRIGLYTKEYKGTDFYSRAYQVGTCAAGIVSIDGKPVAPIPLTGDLGLHSYFIEKVEALEDSYPVVISPVYEEIIKLEGEFMAIMDKLGKSPG